jgi:hypothetical protein
MNNRKLLCRCSMLRIAVVAGALWLGGPAIPAGGGDIPVALDAVGN